MKTAAIHPADGDSSKSWSSMMEATVAPRMLTGKREIGVMFSWIWALAFLTPGLLGFVPNPLIGPEGLFVANAPHNMVHLLTAAAFVGMSFLGNTASIRFMTIFGIVYLMVGVLGVMVLGGEPTGYLLGIVHINGADNFLHVGLGAGILATGLFANSKT